MAEQAALYLELPNTYHAKELGVAWRDLLSEGVIGSGLAVTQRALGANMSVDVAAGVAWVKGDDDVNRQPLYRCRNDATVNLAITAADATKPRVDRVVAHVYDSVFAGALNKWALEILQGVATAGATDANALGAAAIPNNCIELFRVVVPAAAGSILNANIFDHRVAATLGGGAAAISGVPTGAGFDWFTGTAPSGFLLCDGSAVSRTTFAALFAVIGTNYGVGDGSTTFNLPDYRGRVGVTLGTNASVSTLNNNDGQTVGNRRPHHRTSLTDPGHTAAQPRSDGGAGGATTVMSVLGGRIDGGPAASSVTTGITVGSGNANDALDVPSYIVVNRIIKT